MFQPNTTKIGFVHYKIRIIIRQLIVSYFQTQGLSAIVLLKITRSFHVTYITVR